MVLNFKGVAHPPPQRGGRKTQADYSAAELSTARLGAGGGLPVCVEHDHEAKVGNVTSSWQRPDGSLGVSGVIRDADAEKLVRSGQMRGLSLGTSVLQTAAGERLMVKQDELSICEEPRRPGCYVGEIDGRQVRAVHAFSQRGALAG
jgi:hypothetical protein